QVFDSELNARLQHRSHVVGSGPMTKEAGQSPLVRPAAVPVHDDRDVLRQLVGRRNPVEREASRFGHTSRTSCSFRWPIRSISATTVSVCFWRRSWLRRDSSSEIFLSFSSFL